MTTLTFDQSLALSLYQSNEPFPVDFNKAWQWLGYSNKASAKRQLTRFKQGIDFSTSVLKNGQLGRSSDLILLSIDCFKLMAMLAETVQGDMVRQYFLECERIAKQAIAKPAHTLSLIDTSALDALINREGKLQDEVKALESRLTLARNELQNIRRDKAAEARAFAEKYPHVVKHSIKCSEILTDYGNGNKYFSNPLK